MEENDNQVYHFEVGDIHIKQKPMFTVDGKVSNGLQFRPLRQLGFLQRVVRSNARCLDEKRVVYCTGANVVLYDLNTHSQTVFYRRPDENQLSCLKTYKNIYDEDFIMYGTNGGTFSPQVCIINVPKNKHYSVRLTHLEKEEQLVDLCFFMQGSYFITLSEWIDHSRISVFEVESGELKSFEELPFRVMKIAADEAYSNLFMIHGQRDILQCEFENNSLAITSLHVERILDPADEIVDFEIMARISSVVILTKLAYVYFKDFHNAVEVSRIDLGTFRTLDENHEEVEVRRRPSVLALCNYFITVGYELLEELTTIRIPMLDPSQRIVQEIKFRCPLLHKILFINFSDESTSIMLVVQLKDKRSGSTSSENVEMRTISQYLADKGEEARPFASLENHLLPPGKLVPVMLSFLMHDTMVLDYSKDPMDMILGRFVFYKPLLGVAMSHYLSVAVVIGGDRKLRALHLKTEGFAIPHMLMFEYEFNEVPLCVGMHPMNGQVAVGFKQSLRIFVVSQEGLIQTSFNLMIKNCDAIAYSQLGHRVAISSGSQIQILEPYYFRHLCTLNHHNPNSFIRQLQFKNKDVYFMSTCSNGTTYIYSVLQGYEKLFEHVSVRSNRSLVVEYDHIFDFLIVSYPDSHVKFFRSKGQIEFAVMTMYPDRVTAIKVCNEFGVIFFGFSNGLLRAYRWPFNNIKRILKNYTQVMIHDGPVSSIEVSPNLCYLLTTGGEDCALSIHEIQAKSDGILITEAQLEEHTRRFGHELKMIYSLDNYCFTTKYFEQLRKERLREYSTSLNEFLSDIKESEFIYEKDIETLQNKVEQEHRLAKQKEDDQYLQIRQTLNKKKRKLELEVEATVRQFQRQKEVLQNDTQETLKKLYKESAQLVQKKNKYEISSTREREKVVNQHRMEIVHQRKQLEGQESKILALVAQKQKELENNIMQEKEVFVQEEEQHREHLSQQLQNLENRLAQQNRMREDYRNQKISKFENETKRLKGRTKELKQLHSDIESEIGFLLEDKKNYEKQIWEINQILKEKEEIINEKEQEAKEALRRNIHEKHSENAKTHKLSELEEVAIPMIEHLEKLQAQEKVFYQEFRSEVMTRKNFDKESQKASEEIARLKAQLKQYRLGAFISLEKIKSLRGKLELAICGFKDVKSDLKAIYGQFFGSEAATSAEQDQRDGQLDTQLTMRRDIFFKMMDRCKLTEQKQTKNSEKKLSLTNNETIVLLDICNSHKLDNHSLRNKLKSLQRRIDEIRAGEGNDSESFTYPNLDIFKADSSITMFKTPKPLPFQVYEEKKRKVLLARLPQQPKPKIYGVSEMLRELNLSVARAKDKNKSSFANMTVDQTLSMIKQANNDSSYVDSQEILQGLEQRKIKKLMVRSPSQPGSRKEKLKPLP